MTPGVDRGGVVVRAMHAIAGLALVVMMLVVTADVILRAAFRFPIRGAYDIVSIALLVMVFFGIAPVLARRSEILIDLLDAVLPAAGLRALRLVASLGTAVVFLFLAWSFWGPAGDAYRYGDRSLELGLPVWWLWSVAYAGLAGIVWAALRRAWQDLRGGPPSGPGDGAENGEGDVGAGGAGA